MEIDKKPVIGYIPSGSTNDFAGALELSENVLENCRTIVEGKPFTYDIGRFNGDRYFNYIAAFGAFTEVSYETPQVSKNSLGYFAYVIEGMKRLPFNQKHHAKITLNNEVIEDDFLYVSVSNSFSIGGLAFPAKENVNLADGLFEVLIIKAPNNVIDVQSTITRLMAHDFTTPDVRLIQSSKVSFEFDKEVAWTVDGEFGGSEIKADFEVVPKAITIMVPAK